MIIIPEIEAIYVRVPGNEDGTFSQAILDRYSDAHILYNQMEVDGIPIEFKHYDKFGIIRDPIERLWNFYHSHKRKEVTQHSLDAYGTSINDYDFETWLILNSSCFKAERLPQRTRADNTLYDANAIIHHIPENQKSQYFYFMPTNGFAPFAEDSVANANTQIGLYPYSHIQDFAQTIGIREPICNEEPYGSPPVQLTAITRSTVNRLFAWDFHMTEVMRVALLQADRSRNA